MNRLMVASALALAFSQAANARQGTPAPAASATDLADVLFGAWDGNGDGQLSRAEFQTGWQRAQTIARTNAALGRQFSGIDANHDRAIDAGEYRRLVLVKDAGKTAPPLARFDADGNGKLEFAEYVRLVEALAPRQIARHGATK
jgi:Ca2+-binding EF-hand superfamily protein